MTKDEALKLALEALEGLFGIPDYWTSEGGGGVAVWRLGGSDAPRQAITAIKEALAQPEQAWRESASDYERGFIDGMAKQAQSSVDKAVNAMTPPEYEFVTYGKAWATDGENVYVDGVRQEPPDERNFCPRCGKRRGGDVNYIHTCTPPQDTK